MEVRIVQDGTSGASAEADYVRVSAWCDPEQDTLTLATIQRVVHKGQDGMRPHGARRVKTLLAKQPMSPDDALVLAMSYAERKRIPVVVTCTPEEGAERSC
jgi:hypothetical protein